MEATKRCTKCKRVLPREQFLANRNRADGLRCWCQGCEANYRRRNREAIKAQKADYRQRNAEKIKAKKADYWRRNRERIKATNVDYYHRNREAIKAQKADYRQCNTAKWTAPSANPWTGKIKRCSHCYYDHPRVDDGTWASDVTNSDGLDARCLFCRQDDDAHQRAKHRAKWAAPGANPYDGGMKKCGGCKIEKPRLAINFSTTPTNVDGLATICRDCAHIRDVEASRHLTMKAISYETLLLLMETEEERAALIHELVEVEERNLKGLGWINSELEDAFARYVYGEV